MATQRASQGSNTDSRPKVSGKGDMQGDMLRYQGVIGGGPDDTLSIYKDAHVALSIVRNAHVALLILRNAHFPYRYISKFAIACR